MVVIGKKLAMFFGECCKGWWCFPLENKSCWTAGVPGDWLNSSWRLLLNLLVVQKLSKSWSNLNSMACCWTHLFWTCELFLLVGKSLRANCLQKHHRILHAEICANDSMIHPFSKNRRRLIMEIVGFQKKGELQKNPWYKSPSWSNF
jgi:hypothetical protein